MADERCIHNLVVGQCADCKPIPAGLTKNVWISAGGRVFHARPQCWALLEGQEKADREGQQNHPEVRVHVNYALAQGRSPCKPCFPNYKPSPRHEAKPCWVRINGQWTQGTLTQWNRQPSGRWQGVVAYDSDGVLITRTFDQDDLKRR